MTTFAVPLASPWTQGDGFGARGGEHEGDDLATPVGNKVLAAAGGTITYAGLSGGYGNLIKIDHGQGYETRYGHLSSISARVGQIVTTGQVIGISGGAAGLATSGDSTGPHLHFEVRINGKPVNPAPYLGTGTGTVTDANTVGFDPLNPLGLAGGTPAGNAVATLGVIGKQLTDPNFWIRAGLFSLGALFVLFALAKMFSMTDAGAAAIKTGKAAAKDAATAVVLAPK